MITAEQIKPFRTSSDDYGLTEQLKNHFANRRINTQSFYLTEEEFDKILQWKLRGQYGRQQERRKTNTEEVIKTISHVAFTIKHSDKDYELELRLGLLCTLRGVGVPVASAVLALVYPEQYAVIDFRGWRQVFDEEKADFSITDYKKYLDRIRLFANKLSWNPQEADLAIWEFDRVYGWHSRKEER